MESVRLGTLPVTEQHTGDNISLWIEEMLRKFDISTQKIVSFIHVNGSNFVCAGNLLTENLNGQGKVVWIMICNMCIKAGLEINKIQCVVGAAQKLVEHFKKSELANTALQKQQQLMVSDDTNGSVLYIDSSGCCDGQSVRFYQTVTLICNHLHVIY